MTLIVGFLDSQVSRKIWGYQIWVYFLQLNRGWLVASAGKARYSRRLLSLVTLFQLGPDVMPLNFGSPAPCISNLTFLVTMQNSWLWMRFGLRSLKTDKTVWYHTHITPDTCPHSISPSWLNKTDTTSGFSELKVWLAWIFGGVFL